MVLVKKIRTVHVSPFESHSKFSKLVTFGHFYFFFVKGTYLLFSYDEYPILVISACEPNFSKGSSLRNSFFRSRNFIFFRKEQQSSCLG